MSATVVLRSSGAAGYGRHAAPPSAYGPADVHRLLPVPPSGPPAGEQADSEDAPVETIIHAAGSEDVAAGDDGAGEPSADEASLTATGFWARLHLLTRPA